MTGPNTPDLASLFSEQPAPVSGDGLAGMFQAEAPEAATLKPRTRDLPAGLAPSPAASEPQTPLPESSVTGREQAREAAVDELNQESLQGSPGQDMTPLGAGWVRPEDRAFAQVTNSPRDPHLASGKAGSTTEEIRREGERTAERRRYSEADRLWPIVDDILLVVGTDPILQEHTAKLQFVRDQSVDEQQRDALFEILKPRLAANGVSIPDQWDVPALLAMAYDEVLGISVLGDLWRDPDITEIMVDRWDRVVVEKDGRLLETKVQFRNSDHANAVARSLALRVSDRAVSQTIPLVTAELPQARVTFAYGAVVKGGLSITIRKFKPLLGLDSLLAYGSLNNEMVEFLRDSVRMRAGVLVSGGTGSGKTTIINLLSSFIPDSERVITIEDAFELALTNKHVVSLQTKEAASLDDSVSVTLADLLRNTLRMRPDRIIVGEIREGEGASVMLAAANTGHEGTMTTIHANTAALAMNERFVDLIRQVRASSDDASIRRTITSAFELVVQVSRGRGGRRYISEISSVDEVGPDGRIVLSPVFSATQGPDGNITFERFPVNPTGSIGQRMQEAREVLARWATQRS